MYFSDNFMCYSNGKNNFDVMKEGGGLRHCATFLNVVKANIYSNVSHKIDDGICNLTVG